MSDHDKAADICDLIAGCTVIEGLSTVALALIHLCSSNGFGKDQALAAMSRQWDLYEETKREYRQLPETLN